PMAVPVVFSSMRPSKSPITPSTTAMSAPALPCRYSGPISGSPTSTGSRLRPGRFAARPWYPGSMKSGPTLNGATRRPARRSAPIKPVATVVFPLPDAGAAMTTAGTLTPTSAWAHTRVGDDHVCTPTRRKCCDFAVVPYSRVGPRACRESPLDAPLALAARVHRVFDLRHLSHEIRGVEQLLRRIAAGDHDVLGARPRRQGCEHLIDVYPAPFQRIGELVEDVKIVLLLGKPPADLRPAVGGGRRMVDLGAVLARPRPARAHLVPLHGTADPVRLVQPAEFAERGFLPHFPLCALDELKHRDVETLIPCPQR